MKSLKQLIIVGLALGVFLITIGLENVSEGPVEAKLKGHLSVTIPAGQSVELTHDNKAETLNGNGETARELAQGDTVEVKSGTGVEIHFSDRGLVRLSPNAVVNVDVLDPKLDAYVLDVQRGRVWANNAYTSAYFNIVAKGAYLIPDYAAVDVNVDDEKTVVYAHRHQVSVGIVPLNFQAEIPKRFSDDTFINSYILPEGNQTSVFSEKIVQNETTLRKLFYSKLVKEFPFGAIDPQFLNNETWFKENIKLDKAYENKIADRSSQQIRARGLKIGDLSSFGYTFGRSLDSFYNVLTLSKAKVISRINDDVFDHFEDAKYLLLFGQTTRAKERLDFFQKTLDEAFVSQSEPYKMAAMSRLREEYDRLSYVTPDDSLAPAKIMVNNYLLSHLDGSEDDIREKFLLVRNTMNGVYDLADQNSQSARAALEDYFAQFTRLVPTDKTVFARFSHILAEENQIMNNLFRLYPIFYRDRFFAMKSQLEQQWLDLLPEGEGKNEEKQTIVSTKIDFLRQLKTFFLADKIAVDDAKQIVFRLFREADALQLPSDQQVAVNELYAKRLEDFGVFFRYLNSPEYVSTTLHGSSRKTQFEEFLAAQEEQVSIEEIRQEILGNQAAPVITVEKILAQAQKDFEAAGATNVVFGLFSDINQKVIPVDTAVISGATIRAQYSWDSKLVSQIYRGEELISAEPVSLSNLARFIESKTQAPEPVVPPSAPTPTPTPTPVATPSKTERVAKILLIQKLKANDIAVTEADLTITDLSASLFSVSKAILVSDQSISFSFDVDGKNNIVTNIKVTTATGQSSIDGPVDLADVSAEVKAAFEAGKPTS